jgi:ElaB/YqjD/DUF883 family membrane-anchored ribosome-binding protein
MAQGSQYGGRSEDLKEKATEQFKKVADRVEGLASSTADQLRDSGAGEVAGNLKGAVDKSVKDQPMATLAVAAAVGFVLGALWKS